LSLATLSNSALVNMLDERLGPCRRDEANRTRFTPFSPECPLNQIISDRFGLLNNE